MDKAALIQKLGLELHPKEGGYFKRTYQSDLSIDTPEGSRYLLTSIFYLLTDDQPTGFLHKNRSDIIHYYQLGAPTEYVVVNSVGELSRHILGPDLEKGHVLQLTVKGGDWKGSKLLGTGYSLISEAVSPGFDYGDNTLALAEHVVQFPEATQKALAGFIRAND
ncbi:MAG: cupin domain-containing protein [Pseudomonadales bacterium]|nr:cupin domain-containing protein [Pseudomonadales bacterium]